MTSAARLRSLSAAVVFARVAIAVGINPIEIVADLVDERDGLLEDQRCCTRMRSATPPNDINAQDASTPAGRLLRVFVNAETAFDARGNIGTAFRKLC
jgi:hypothetical protein